MFIYRKVPDGSMASHRLRITIFTPVGFLEYTYGPLNGTKLMQYCTPKGSKTWVTVVGSPG